MFHVEAVRQQEHAERETVNNSERARASECCMTAPLANPDTHKLQPHEAVTHTHTKQCRLKAFRMNVHGSGFAHTVSACCQCTRVDVLPVFDGCSTSLAPLHLYHD